MAGQEIQGEGRYMRMMQIWTDDIPGCGCGYRRILEVERARKFTTFLYPPLLRRVRILNEVVDRCGVEVGFSPREVRSVILNAVHTARQGTTLYDEEKQTTLQQEFRYPKKFVKEVLKTLRGLPKYVLVETTNKVHK